jgi:hypothetical protein
MFRDLKETILITTVFTERSNSAFGLIKSPSIAR